MKHFGFCIDYKKCRKRIQYQFTTATVLSFIITNILLTFYFHKSTRPFKEIVIFYASYILAFASRGIITIKYSYVLLSLSTRYGQLNALLRCVNRELIICLRITISNCFLNEIRNQSSLDLHSNRVDKKLLIKRVGKFYDDLCEIMETVNFTHSFQVR